MSPVKTENQRNAIDTAPLFASVWLALFNELRKNYLAHKSADVNPGAGDNVKTRL